MHIKTHFARIEAGFRFILHVASSSISVFFHSRVNITSVSLEEAALSLSQGYKWLRLLFRSVSLMFLVLLIMLLQIHSRPQSYFDHKIMCHTFFFLLFLCRLPHAPNPYCSSQSQWFISKPFFLTWLRFVGFLILADVKHWPNSLRLYTKYQKRVQWYRITTSIQRERFRGRNPSLR